MACDRVHARCHPGDSWHFVLGDESRAVHRVFQGNGSNPWPYAHRFLESFTIRVLDASGRAEGSDEAAGGCMVVCRPCSARRVTPCDPDDFVHQKVGVLAGSRTRFRGGRGAAELVSDLLADFMGSLLRLSRPVLGMADLGGTAVDLPAHRHRFGHSVSMPARVCARSETPRAVFNEWRAHDACRPVRMLHAADGDRDFLHRGRAFTASGRAP